MSANRTDMTPEECFESLTGWEEIAIAKAFGSEVSTLADKHPTTFMRALCFVVHKREGEDDATAKASAMGLTLKECDGYFEDEPDDPDPTDPDSAAGKGDSAPGNGPKS